MKIYAIKDGDQNDKTVGYLFYSQSSDEAYIELPEGDAWDFPFILESFVRRGRTCVDSYWTREWLRQRIVPADRQNLGAVLKANHLKMYDEWKLLFLADGRCAQDECYIEAVSEGELPWYILKRRKQRISELTELQSKKFLVVFYDQSSGIVELEDLNDNQEWFGRLTAYYQHFSNASISVNGSGITWGEERIITYDRISEIIRPMPISGEVLHSYAAQQIISTSEAMSMLQCSRQNIDDLVKRGRIRPLDIQAKSKLFFRCDILKLMD